MGLFSGFSGSSHRITPTEFHNNVRSSLSSHGLSHSDINHVESVVKLSLNESGSRRGLDRNEVKQAINYLHHNRDGHQLTDHQLKTVEKVLNEHL